MKIVFVELSLEGTESVLFEVDPQDLLNKLVLLEDNNVLSVIAPGNESLQGRIPHYPGQLCQEWGQNLQIDYSWRSRTNVCRFFVPWDLFCHFNIKYNRFYLSDDLIRIYIYY